jgi:hypothetical protein
MFVLMVAELHPVLSDATPGLARRAKLGDRFRYWRGRSGTRYLFSAVPFETLADYRSAVAILAEPTADGSFLAWTAALIDASGRLDADTSWPEGVPYGSIAFVHFLTETESEQRALLGDVFTPAEPAEPAEAAKFSLAA